MSLLMVFPLLLSSFRDAPLVGNYRPEAQSGIHTPGGGCGFRARFATLTPRNDEDQSSNAGGGTKPPNSRSISSANFSGVRSSSQGPTICTPTGKPSGDRPIGMAVSGRPGSVAMPGNAS